VGISFVSREVMVLRGLLLSGFVSQCSPFGSSPLIAVQALSGF